MGLSSGSEALLAVSAPDMIFPRRASNFTELVDSPAEMGELGAAFGELLGRIPPSAVLIEGQICGFTL